MAIIKEVIGEVLKQLIEEPDQLKRMEIIDNAEILNTEHSEMVEDGNRWETMYNDLLNKYTERFTGELVDKEVQQVDEDEIDTVVVDEENDEKDYTNMSYDEAGFKDVLKKKEE